MNKIKQPGLFAVYVFTLIFCCSATHISYAQQTINDNRFRQLHDSLPKGWEMEAVIQPFDADEEPELFVFITRIDSVKLLQVNKINAPKEFYDGLDERVQKKGKTTVLELKMKLEPKWSMEKLQKVWAYNDSIQHLIDTAYTKYKIGDLEQALGRGDFTYDDSTPEKRRRLKAYNEEREKLHRQKIPWPGYSSSTYSVFFYYDYNAENYRAVYPPEAVWEEHRVAEMVRRILKAEYGY